MFDRRFCLKFFLCCTALGVLLYVIMLSKIENKEMPQIQNAPSLLSSIVNGELRHIIFPVTNVSLDDLPSARAVTKSEQNTTDKKYTAVTNISLSNYDVLIVGAGLSGAVLAERHASLGHRVLVIDRRSHIAGNCYDYIDEQSQLRVSKYGAHLFHTNNERVWEYVNEFAQWKAWHHRVLAFVDGHYVPIPVNIQTVNTLLGLNLFTGLQIDEWLKLAQIKPPNGDPQNSEEMALSRVGRVLYEKIFSPYTQKQWNTSAASLDPSVLGRIPVRNSFDDRYFADTYQALPSDGYTAFVEKILSNPLVTTKLNVDYFDLSKTNITTYYTGPIDRFYGQEGLLEYRSLLFGRVDFNNIQGTVLPTAVVNYPSLEYAYTREVEYKHFLYQNSSRSVIFREYPTSEGEPYYPVPTQKNRDAYKRLVDQHPNQGNVTFVGRLANYKYFNMDEAIGNALKIFQQKYAIHIVITKFKENLSWTSELCSKLVGQAVGWVVFLKDPTGDVQALKNELKQSIKGGCRTISVSVIDHRQNVGREGLAWLEYMLNDVNLAAYNVFLQGGHEAPLDKVLEAIKLRKHYYPFHGVGYGPSNATIAAFFSDIFFQIVYRTMKMETLCTHMRGEFAVTGDAIIKMLKKWKPLLTEHIIPKLRESNDPPVGHVLERLWLELFGARKDYCKT